MCQRGCAMLSLTVIRLVAKRMLANKLSDGNDYS
jgi:hypothetical protein